MGVGHLMLARTRLVPLINSVRGFCTLYGEDFWNSEAAVNRLDLTPYGDELAVRVIERIDNGRFIGSVHQGYCGWALGKHRNCGLYILGRNEQGDILHDAFECGTTTHKGDITWTSKDSLLDWLSKQSDYTMSGADTSSDIGRVIRGNKYLINNQTITRDVLCKFIQE